MLQWMKKPVRGGLEKGFIKGTIIFKMVYLYRIDSLKLLLGNLYLNFKHLRKYF